MQNGPNPYCRCTRQRKKCRCNYGVWRRSEYMRRCVVKTVIYCNHTLSDLDRIRCLRGNLYRNFYPSYFDEKLNSNGIKIMNYIGKAPIFLPSLGETISVCIWLYTVCIYSLHAPVIKCSSTNLLFLCDGCVCVCVYSGLRGSLVLRSRCVCAVSVCVQQAGEVRAVRRHFLPVKNNVQVMERTKPRQWGVCVNGMERWRLLRGWVSVKTHRYKCASFFLSSYHF